MASPFVKRIIVTPWFGVSKGSRPLATAQAYLEKLVNAVDGEILQFQVLISDDHHSCAFVALVEFPRLMAKLWKELTNEV